MSEALQNLRLIVQDNPNNLFVRLDAQTITDLTGDRIQRDFLPLAISIADQTIYTSWNGGLIETDDSIEIPSSLLARMPSFPPTATVKVLSSIPSCIQVHVEPRNAKDWELLESYAEALESGLLLKQISVVYTKQFLTLKIKRDQIDILVKKIETNEEDGIACLSERDTPVYGLLLQDTELVISPKLRNPRETVDWSTPLQLIPCQEDWNEAMLDFHSLMKVSPLQVPFSSVFVSEAIWNSSYDWALLKGNDSPEKSQQLVRVIPHSSIPNGQAGMFSEAMYMASYAYPSPYDSVTKKNHANSEHHDDYDIITENSLHPLIRLELGLNLYWKSIRLRPTSVPEETSLDTILLRPIQCKKDQSIPVFRRPNLKPFREAGASHAPSLPIIHDQLGIPLHSVVPLSLFTSAGNQIESTKKVKSNYFRVISKTDVETDEISRPLGSIVVLDHNERMQLWKLHNDSCQDGEAEVLHQSELDDLVNSLSKPVVSSTVWAEGILSDLSRNSRMMVILCGPTGSGKTFSSLLLCAMATTKQHKATLYLDCKLLQESSSRLDEILSELDSIFEHAVKAKDCVVVFDELDRLAPNLLGGDENDDSVRVQSANPIAVSQSKVIADRFLQLIEATSASGVSMVITCSNAESINTSLHRSAQIFQTQIDVPVLSARDRLSVLRQMVNPLVPDTSSWDSNTIGKRTEGFRPLDLEKIASRAHQMLRSKHNAVSVSDALEHVLNEYTPISHLSLSQNEKVVSPTWSNIGGLFKVKSKLESTILHPVKYKLIYEQASIRLPRGVLLFGPPGCGKSALVPALAQACNLPLISCKGPEVLDKYIGASEAKIRELFKRASDVAPSIIFLDELDALAPRRGSDHTGVTDRVVNQLLTFLDGVEDISKSTVFIIGATSRPDKIDNALLRPGRLEQHLYVGPPNTEDELNDLFTKQIKNWNLSADCQKSISSKAQVQDILRHVSGSHRFSPADLKAALETAHVNAVHRHLESAKPEEIEQIEISKQDLTVALRTTRPSLNPDDSRDLENVYRAFKGEVKGSSQSETKLKTTLK